jgi:hypothetical protein
VFLSRNIRELALLRNRYEGQTIKSKVYGYFKLSHYDVLYGDISQLIDFSEADRNYCSISISNSIITIKLDNTVKAFGNLNVPYNMYIASLSGIRNEVRDNYNTLKGCIVDTSTYKILEVSSIFKALPEIVYYLDANNQNITPNYSEADYNPGGGSHYSPGPSGWDGWDMTTSLSHTLFIPNEINKIFVGLFADYDGELSIATLAPNLVSINTLSTKGTTANRPVGLPASVPYFDTDLNKLVWYDGNGTTGWIDATGTPV